MRNIDGWTIAVYTAFMNDDPRQLDTAKFARMGRLCTCANLRSASRAITHVYDEFLRSSGLPTTQFLLLAALGAQEETTLTPLAEDLGMDPTTLARNLKPLERDGLVCIDAGRDRRTRVLRLTERGVTTLEGAYPLWEQAQRWIIGQVGEDQWRTMLGDWSYLTALARR